MSNRITKSNLNGVIELLNRVTNSPAEPYVKVGDKYTAQVGNYHLSSAYGGYSLHHMANESGGVRDVFSRGHMPARELYELIHAYRRGFELGSAKV